MPASEEAAPWQARLVEEMKRSLAHDPYWRERFQEQNFGVHLAILVDPYLQYVLDGKKTVESRFTVTRCAPYQQVEMGDIVLLKKAGGPVVGICEVRQVWFYELEPSSWEEIRTAFTQVLCAQDPNFWKDRESAAFATLMQIENVAPVQPLTCLKRDRRGWVVLLPHQRQFTLLL